MEPQQLLDILAVAHRLKETTRHNWISENRKESVADHSWRIALMAMLLDGVPEFFHTDLNRVIRMCLIHDLGEAFTGDIPTFEKSESDSSTEEQLYFRWINEFPEPQRSDWLELLHEMQQQNTPEAKLYKALDKLEAVISHNEADIASWLPLEYDLQKTYAVKNTTYSPYLTSVRQAVDAWTDQKTNDAKERNP